MEEELRSFPSNTRHLYLYKLEKPPFQKELHPLVLLESWHQVPMALCAMHSCLLGTCSWLVLFSLSYIEIGFRPSAEFTPLPTFLAATHSLRPDLLADLLPMFCCLSVVP